MKTIRVQGNVKSWQTVEFEMQVPDDFKLDGPIDRAMERKMEMFAADTAVDCRDDIFVSEFDILDIKAVEEEEA